MNIFNYLYTQDADLDEVLEEQTSQTVGGRQQVAPQNEFLRNAMTFATNAKDSIEHQFDALNTGLQTVH